MDAPESAAVGKGRAFLSLTPELVNASTTSAFAAMSSGWIPGETVQIYTNGTANGTFTADGNGRLQLYYTTGAGFGLLSKVVIKAYRVPAALGASVSRKS